jgi:hypothetical protein
MLRLFESINLLDFWEIALRASAPARKGMGE